MISLDNVLDDRAAKHRDYKQMSHQIITKNNPQRQEPQPKQKMTTAGVEPAIS